MDRTLGIGGSDAKRIIEGDWHTLWLEKTKRVEPVDLSDVLPVQMGITTEKLNIDWLEKALVNEGYKDTEIKRDVTLEQKDFMMSHLDEHIGKCCSVLLLSVATLHDALRC